MSVDSRARGVFGAAAVVLNIGGVVALYGVPHAYRVGSLALWQAELLEHPVSSAISALCFTLGLLALAVWSSLLGRSIGSDAARGAGMLIAFGSLVNAASTLTPITLAYHLTPTVSDEVGRTLLGLTLSADALFNLVLGIGLITMATQWSAERGVWLGRAGYLAGAESIPVALQAVYDPAASWLAVAGPMWLMFVTVESASSLRQGLRQRATASSARRGILAQGSGSPHV